MRLADGNLYLHNSLDGLASASHVLPVCVCGYLLAIWGICSFTLHIKMVCHNAS